MKSGLSSFSVLRWGIPCIQGTKLCYRDEWFWHICRGVRGQNILRELLGDMVQGVISQEDLVLNISPTDVYKAWINQMESQTGEKSWVSISPLCPFTLILLSMLLEVPCLC